MNQNEKILLFGAGFYGERILDCLCLQCDVLAFIDNNEDKQGNFLRGVPIISPKNIATYAYDKIIITFWGEGGAVARSLIENYDVREEKILNYFESNYFDARSATLFLAAREINENNMQGNVAEVGVYQGDFARHINLLFPDRKLYLFDTFEGFHEKDVAFDVKNGFSSASEGAYCSSDIEAILERMRYPQRCVIKKGVFPDTAIGLEDSFVLVSLDVDLYKPTYSALQYFYPRMVEGGYIFIHDYNNSIFSGVKKAVQDFRMETKIKSIPICDLCGSLVIVK